MPTATKKTDTPKGISKSEVPENDAPVAAEDDPIVIDDSVIAAGEEAVAEQSDAEDMVVDEDPIEILDPKSDPKRWIIGQPPELGGGEDQYSVYIQEPLGYLPRLRFFSLVTKTTAEAIKAGGMSSLSGMDDVFGAEGGSIRDRTQKLTQQDFSDAGSFMALALELMSYSPDFLLECYCMWLNVPRGERNWAKRVMDRQWNPERGEFGLKQDDGLEMVAIFLDQNYEDIFDFFTVELPKLFTRGKQLDRRHKARALESGQSKR